MRKLFVFLFGLFHICLTQTMQIHTNLGVDYYKLAEIDSITFSVNESNNITDIDGNVYKTIKIGDQWWMTENLKVTHYRNGDPIPNVTSNSEWGNLSSGAYCAYDNDESNIETYGLLYNLYAVNDSRNIAPEGWHVPTDEEWKELEMYLGMSQGEADGTGYRGTDEGGKLKATGTIEGGDGLWLAPNEGATNESGFSAVPGAYRYGNGDYNTHLGFYAYFWSDTLGTYNGWGRNLISNGEYSAQVRRHGHNKRHGFSVRCVRD